MQKKYLPVLKAETKFTQLVGNGSDFSTVKIIDLQHISPWKMAQKL
jgi:hypothetical protein